MPAHTLARAATGRPATGAIRPPARPARRSLAVVSAFPGPTPSGGPIKGLGAAHQRKLGDSDLMVSCELLMVVT